MANKLVISADPNDIDIPADGRMADGTEFTLGKGFGIGGASWRRQTIESPFLPGRVLVAAVQDTQIMAIPIIVTAPNPTAIYNRLTKIIGAFTQFKYTLNYYHERQDSVVVQYAWVCELADYVVTEGGILEGDPDHTPLYQKVIFSVPRSPVASGPL